MVDLLTSPYKGSSPNDAPSDIRPPSPSYKRMASAGLGRLPTTLCTLLSLLITTSGMWLDIPPLRLPKRKCKLKWRIQKYLTLTRTNIQLTWNWMAVPCFDHELDTSSGHMNGEPRDTKFVQWIIHVYIPPFSHINEGTLYRIVDPRVKFHPYSLYYVILYDI